MTNGSGMRVNDDFRIRDVIDECHRAIHTITLPFVIDKRQHAIDKRQILRKRRMRTRTLAGASATVEAWAD